MIAADGRVVWFRDIIEVVLHRGKVKELVGVMVEMTCRKLAEEAVLRSEEQYRLFFEDNPHPMWVVDAETNAFLAVNEAAVQHYGYSREEFLAMKVKDIRPGRDVPRLQEYLRTAPEGLNRAGPWRHIKKDGAQVEAEVSFHQITFAGRPARLVLAQDVTERRRMENEVLEARDHLQVLSRRLVEVQESERRQIACELHDEIGQVLNALKLTVDLAVRHPSQPQTQTRLGQAQGEVNRLIQRVREIALDLRPAILDDLGLLPALLWHFQRYTRQTGVQIRFSHHGLEGRRFAQTVETAAYRVIQEALTNVARHAKVKEAVVHCRLLRGNLRLGIEDDGAGFDLKAILAARNSSGLSGMRERVTLLGGQMRVQTSPGHGTRLFATLPVPPSQDSSLNPHPHEDRKDHNHRPGG
jgi:PAS domain S-box-containing protein